MSKIKQKPKIVIVPHYVGTEKQTDIFRRVLSESAEKKISHTNIKKEVAIQN